MKTTTTLSLQIATALARKAQRMPQHLKLINYSMHFLVMTSNEPHYHIVQLFLTTLALKCIHYCVKRLNGHQTIICL